MLLITYATHNKQAAGLALFQTQQLNIKDEGGIRRDDAWVAFVSISIVRRAGQLGSLTNTHLEEEEEEADDAKREKRKREKHNGGYGAASLPKQSAVEVR